jgi:hypothetical protein
MKDMCDMMFHRQTSMNHQDVEGGVRVCAWFFLSLSNHFLDLNVFIWLWPAITISGKF